MVLNLVVASAHRQTTRYLLGMVVWLLAVTLREGGVASADTVSAAVTSWPLVYFFGAWLGRLYDAVLK
jgi:hypothetical protein